ncbi:MAG: hypothetical protein ACREMB_27530 [Candidatus Rokuibacteriota bacterium]
MPLLTRRQLLAWAVGFGLGGGRPARAAVQRRTVPFAADVELLYGTLSFHVSGTIEESVDRAAGVYDVAVAGRGDGIETTVEGSGVLRGGRWAPRRTAAFFLVHGRETRSNIDYDHDRRQVAYRSRSETFFLRRIRAADDRLTVPPGVHVDDVLSATLNYADGLWPAEPDGSLRTHVVRRQRAAGEGPDDVQRSYQAELVPLVLRIQPDRDAGRTTALFDMTRFSSWAREDRPARIVFGPGRRPETITSSLVLGTSFSIRIG